MKVFAYLKTLKSFIVVAFLCKRCKNCRLKSVIVLVKAKNP